MTIIKSNTNKRTHIHAENISFVLYSPKREKERYMHAHHGRTPNHARPLVRTRHLENLPLKVPIHTTH